MFGARVRRSRYGAGDRGFRAHVDDGAVLLDFHEGKDSADHAQGYCEVYGHDAVELCVGEGVGCLECVHYSSDVGEDVNFLAVGKSVSWLVGGIDDIKRDDADMLDYLPVFCYTDPDDFITFSFFCKISSVEVKSFLVLAVDFGVVHLIYLVDVSIAFEPRSEKWLHLDFQNPISGHSLSRLFRQF